MAKADAAGRIKRKSEWSSGGDSPPPNSRGIAAGRRRHAEVAGATQARLKLGLSQADFAAMIGVSVRTLRNWERGKHEPSKAAKVLLKVTLAAPKTVHKILASA